MEKEILEQLKREVKSKKEQIESNKKELEDLYTHSSSVKRYIELMNEQKRLTHGEMTLDEKQILVESDSFCSILSNIQETNDLWYLAGYYKCGKDFYVDFPFDDSSNLNFDLYVYINLENLERKFIKPNEKETFESEHTIISKSSQCNWDLDFVETRQDFFLTCINEGQEVAVQKILSRNKKN